MHNAKKPIEWARELQSVAAALKKEMNEHFRRLKEAEGAVLPLTWEQVRLTAASEIRIGLGSRYRANDRKLLLELSQKTAGVRNVKERLLEQLRRSIQSTSLFQSVLNTSVDAERLATSASEVEIAIIACEQAGRELDALERCASSYQKSLNLDLEPMSSLSLSKKHEVDQSLMLAVADRDKQIASSRCSHDLIEEGLNQLNFEATDMAALVDFRPTILIDEDPSRPGRPLIPPALRQTLLECGMSHNDPGLSVGLGVAGPQVAQAGFGIQARVTDQSHI